MRAGRHKGVGKKRIFSCEADQEGKYRGRAKEVVLLFAIAFTGASSSIFGEEVTQMEKSIGRSRVAKPYAPTKLGIYVCG